jgi:colanic acid/amylovoran biosynthesis protein
MEHTESQSQTQPSVTNVALVGAAFAGNKGAATMLEAVIQVLPDTLGKCRFSVLTTYPAEDRRERPSSDIKVVGFGPLAVLVAFVNACIWALGNAVGLGRIVPSTAAVKTLRNADVVVDVCGISFSDSRGLPRHLYHFLLAMTPVLLKRPTCKLSQALGPFRHPVNRTFARVALPRLDAICARGSQTLDNLSDVAAGRRWFDRVEPCADLGFSFNHELTGPSTVLDAALKSTNIANAVVVMPSAVVKKASAGSGTAYVEIVAGAVTSLLESSDLEVVIAAHSTREGNADSRMNDLPTCRAVYQLIPTHLHDRVTLVDASLSASELRSLIASSRCLVTSRFHAMVSALATATPLVVVGWSHKYHEVLAEFGVDRFAIPYEDLTPEELSEKVTDALGDSAALSKQISAALPAVQASAQRNFEVVKSVLARR